MEIHNLPWRDGVAAVMAAILLKMLWDAVYRKIPSGFKSVRVLLESQAEQARDRHAEHMGKQNLIEEAIKELRATKCRGRRGHKRGASTPPKKPRP